MYIEKHLATASKLIEAYSGPFPFAVYLKDYFRQNKQHGSRDRKVITALCYGYFRLGKNILQLATGPKALLGLLLTTDNPDWANALLPVTYTHFPFLNEAFFRHTSAKRFAIAKEYLNLKEEWLFPLINHLPFKADKMAFALSHLQQPGFWIRAKKGKAEEIEVELKKRGIQYKKTDDLKNALQLPQGTDLEKLFGNYHTLLEVQDISSQRTGNALHFAKGENAWDCCCGAGGKSLMLRDKFDINLHSSDVRDSILINLEKRFRQSGEKLPATACINLGEFSGTAIEFGNIKITAPYFDAIIADVPCTGSGTWGRTPENLVYFKEEEIARYAALQRKIVANSLRFLKPGGRLYYITCSVFTEENEGQQTYFETLGLKLQQQTHLYGYEIGGDSMYMAEFRN